jgi:hypothetical protein
MNLKAFVETLSVEERGQLLSILTSHLDTVETPTPTQKEAVNEKPQAAKSNINEDFTMNTSNSIKSTNKRIPVQARKNTWSDTGEDRHIETPSVTRTPRNRKPPAKKDVVCSACGKKDKVNSSLVYGEYYRCERCVGK